MPLIIFDIDGTLTDTTGVDDECFSRAVARSLNVRDVSTDWSTYPHATDSGLAKEISRRHLGRELTQAAMEDLRRVFVGLLHDEARERPGRFSATPGAAELIRTLTQRAGWRVAIATGAWHASAQVKLTTSRLGLGHLPLATSDDSDDRARIIQTAAARALNVEVDQAARTLREDAQGLGGVVYVGDGVWDARTARSLGIGFVGVRLRGGPARLHAEGARWVCEGFADGPGTLDLLERAIQGSWR